MSELYSFSVQLLQSARKRQLMVVAGPDAEMPHGTSQETASTLPPLWSALSLIEQLAQSGICTSLDAIGRLCDHEKKPVLDLKGFIQQPTTLSMPNIAFPLLSIGNQNLKNGSRVATLITSEPGIDSLLIEWIHEAHPSAKLFYHALCQFFNADQINFLYVLTEDFRRLLLDAVHGDRGPLLSTLENANVTQREIVPTSPFIAIENYQYPLALLQIFPTELHSRYRQIPIFANLQAGLLTLAGPVPPTSEQKANLLAMLRRTLNRGFRIQHVLACPQQTDRIISRSEAGRVDVEALASEVDHRLQTAKHHISIHQSNRSEVIQLEELLRKSSGDSDAEAKAKDLLSEILLRGFQDSASDIHLSNQEDRFWVRYRVDGVLHDHPYRFSKNLARLVIARVKVLARLDHAYSALPQDGAFMAEHSQRRWEIRVSVANTEIGEQAVLRLHDPNGNLPTLEGLGFRRHESDLIRGAVETDHGLLIVCGPTGSGKSTTLYSILTHLIDRSCWKVITGEQPVEIRIPFTEQIPIVAPLTFAKFNESALRQDPDYILVGETRDPETALQVVRAANTGHNVFTTLHTNSAAEACGRLVDLGVAPYLLADCLYAVVAQRLVRLLCDKCKRPRTITREFLDAQTSLLKHYLKLDHPIYEPKGCTHCHNLGYHGRTCISEGFQVQDGLRDAIANRQSATEITTLQKTQGGLTLFEQALQLVTEGRISLTQALVLNRS